MSHDVSVHLVTPGFDHKNAVWLRSVNKELPWPMMREVLTDALGVDVFVEGAPDTYIDAENAYLVEPLLASIVLDLPGNPPMKCAGACIGIDLVMERITATVYFCTYAEYLGDTYLGAPSARRFFAEEVLVLDSEMPEWMITESSAMCAESSGI